MPLSLAATLDASAPYRFLAPRQVRIVRAGHRASVWSRGFATQALDTVGYGHGGVALREPPCEHDVHHCSGAIGG